MARRIKTDKEKMDALIQFALQHKYKDGINELMQVVKATPNPVVAAEILVGIYEQPEILRLPHEKASLGSTSVNVEFISYDPIADEVKYAYQEANIVFGWVDRAIEEPTADDIQIQGNDSFYTTRDWNEKAEKHNTRISVEASNEVMKKIYDDNEAFKKDFKKYQYVKEVKERIYQATCSLNNWTGTSNNRY